MYKVQVLFAKAFDDLFCGGAFTDRSALAKQVVKMSGYFEYFSSQYCDFFGDIDENNIYLLFGNNGDFSSDDPFAHPYVTLGAFSDKYDAESRRRDYCDDYQSTFCTSVTLNDTGGFYVDS